MNFSQKKIYEKIASAASLSTPLTKIAVEQGPTYLKEPVQVADYAAGVIAACGASAVELGEARGLPSQEIAVDRRHAVLSFNDFYYHYINGVALVSGDIIVPANGLFETRDGKWICTNGAYPHLRDGILRYFDVPHDQGRLIEAFKRHDSTKILEDFERLGLCAAPLYTKDEWLAHPQGEILAKSPIVLEQRGIAKGRVLPEAKNRPLEGVRVVDCTHVVAGPWLTRQLAEHGADVISVRNVEFPFIYPTGSFDTRFTLLNRG